MPINNPSSLNPFAANPSSNPFFNLIEWLNDLGLNGGDIGVVPAAIGLWDLPNGYIAFKINDGEVTISDGPDSTTTDNFRTALGLNDGTRAYVADATNAYNVQKNVGTYVGTQDLFNGAEGYVYQAVHATQDDNGNNLSNLFDGINGWTYQSQKLYDITGNDFYFNGSVWYSTLGISSGSDITANDFYGNGASLTEINAKYLGGVVWSDILVDFNTGTVLKALNDSAGRQIDQTYVEVAAIQQLFDGSGGWVFRASNTDSIWDGGSYVNASALFDGSSGRVASAVYANTDVFGNPLDALFNGNGGHVAVSEGAYSIWDGSGFFDSAAIFQSVDFENRNLLDGTGTPSLDWIARGFYGEWFFDDVVFASIRILPPSGANPSIESGQASTYIKGNKFIVSYKDGSTMKYRYMDLTSTDATWTYTTTAP